MIDAEEQKWSAQEQAVLAMKENLDGLKQRLKEVQGAIKREGQAKNASAQEVTLHLNFI